ncbi:hypothetical protein NM688_g3017 [Phlebia brevispora]|uniref:Uncharacterized protein n=1 Tax=Phlebia brevispora TaxID=194682 RepID=A0ACC1T760_9APHY|nr:hypothetical protein NM688_g3017 [Phlebia brevispora]
MSLATPKVEEHNIPPAQRAALSYASPSHQSQTAEAGPSSSHARSRTASSRLDPAHSPEAAELATFSFSPSRRSSISQTLAPTLAPTSSARSQPALVRKKDSPALKPIPAAALLHSPPHSPPLRAMHGREGSLSIPVFSSTSRSRSGSVASVAPSREGSVYEGRTGRRESSRPVLPSFQPLPPMEFVKTTEDDD